jgi:hypothetical protein
MSLEEFYVWSEQTPIGVWLQTTTYPFPVIEAVHLLAITLMLGTLYAVNFRILGFVLKSRPLSEVVDGLAPWIWAGTIITFATGVPLFMSEALKLGANAAWAPKMQMLVSAAVVQLFLSIFILRGGRAESYPALAKVAAALSTVLWFVTGYEARWIAFV